MASDGGLGKLKNGSEDVNVNYIIFSDVHLGADLVQHVRPMTVARLKQVARVDRDLATMLDWYRSRSDPDRAWRLIIAGDLVDFIGMSIAPQPEDGALETALNDEEQEHGLGSAYDHAVKKMRAVARRHRLVFERLAHFIGEGHSLVLVRGNHDIDFHWDAAKRAFIEALVERVDGLMEDSVRRAEFESRVEFYPWFYYIHGLLYVEHGHQFDAMCNYSNLLAPVSPLDPKRLLWSLSDLLVRLVVRPTPGLGSEGHEHRGLFDYIRFAYSMGVRGALKLGYRYMFAIKQAFMLGRDQVHEAAIAIREEHERKMAEIAERTRVHMDKLRMLTALWPKPVSSGVFPLLHSVLVDRIAAGLFTAMILITLAFLDASMTYRVIAALVVSLSCLAYLIWSGRERSGILNPSAALRRAAQQIASVLPARFIVMGHTHEPIVESVTEQTTYINLGNWGVDDLDSDTTIAPRTHLVLRWIDGAPQAEFCRWDPETGPHPVTKPTIGS